MRCATHLDREAVGVCIRCGAGVCPSCRVTVADLTYCSPCLEAGTYHPQLVTATAPKSTPALPQELTGYANRTVLTLGAVGFLLFGIAMQFVWIGDLVGSYWWALPLHRLLGATNPFETLAVVLVGTSVSLSGYAFTVYARAFPSRICRATAIVSLFSAWWLPIANFLQLTGLVWVPVAIYSDYIVWTSGPLYLHYGILQFIGVAMLGTTLLLWPSALVMMRHLLHQQRIAIPAAVLFVAAAHVVLLPLAFSAIILFSPYPYFSYPFYPLFLIVACLVEPACVLSAILIYRSQGRK